MDAITYVHVKLAKVESLRKATHTEFGNIILNMLENVYRHDLAELKKGADIE